MIPSEINTEAYRLLFEIENALREFMIDQGERLFGAKWYESVLSTDQAKRLRATQSWTSRCTIHPLYFADFAALGEALRERRNAGLGTLFVSGNTKVIVEHITPLTPLRNAVAHSRPVTYDELAQIRVGHSQLRTELGAERFDLLCKLPSTSRTREEMARLHSELEAAGLAVTRGDAACLSVCDELQTRWWLSSDWLTGADHVLELIRRLREYVSVRESDAYGHRPRAQRWQRDHWDAELLQRATAVLSRDFAIFQRGAP